MPIPAARSVRAIFWYSPRYSGANWIIRTGAVVATLGSSFSFTGAKVANYAPERMWGAALTLVALVLILNLVARLAARRSRMA